MELSFAAAGWLAGLSALAVPVLLHWLASQQQPPSRFAPMRFLQQLAAEQRGRRLSDLLLLLVRLLLLIVVVLALAGPTVHRSVIRSQSVTLLHPSLPGLVSSEDHFRLCAGGELLPVAQTCSATATTQPDPFLSSLHTAIAEHPEWAKVTVRVPATLAVSPLRLPTFPLPLDWQIDPAGTDAADAAPAPWRVAATADDWHIFAAANAVAPATRWQRAESVDESVANPDAKSVANSVSDADLVIGGDADRAGQAAVWWHNQPADWQRSSTDAISWDYLVSENQLQLRWTGENPAQAAVLLEQSENWFRRGHWQPQLNPATLKLGSETPARATRSTELTPWLVLLALLCWWFERRLAHGRR